MGAGALLGGKRYGRCPKLISLSQRSKSPSYSCSHLQAVPSQGSAMDEVNRAIPAGFPVFLPGHPGGIQHLPWLPRPDTPTLSRSLTAPKSRHHPASKSSSVRMTPKGSSHQAPFASLLCTVTVRTQALELDCPGSNPALPLPGCRMRTNHSVSASLSFCLPKWARWL